MMTARRRNLPAAMLLLFLLVAGLARAQTPKPVRVLFVGNSVTYVGNLPAVLEALAAGNGKSIRADMIAKGGATLTQWLDGGSVRRALRTSHYGYVVLQERGGDFACGFGPEVCRDSRHALHVLAQVIRAHGAKPVLLGTYQVMPAASAEIVLKESAAASHEHVPYVSASGRLQSGLARFPHEDWFWQDRMHPGHELALLDAVLLYRQVFGSLPAARPLPVHAPMFVPSTKFSPSDPVSRPLPTARASMGYTYSAESVRHAIELARGH